jgi:hypothetical protein
VLHIKPVLGGSLLFQIKELVCRVEYPGPFTSGSQKIKEPVQILDQQFSK